MTEEHRHRTESESDNEDLEEFDSRPSLREAWAMMVADFHSLFAPRFEELFQEKEELKQVVLTWRYPDGSLVPPGKRAKLMGRLRRLSRQVRQHPDNPSNRKA